MNEPIVSIIMPARDVESYIEVAIQSVLDQEYVHWELIVVDNASVDNTAARVKEFRDKRIRIIHTDTPGLSNARNIGLQYASGEYICFLDADDRLTPRSLSLRIAKFLENPALQFIDGGMELYDNTFTRLHHRWSPSFRGIPYTEMMLLLPGCFCGITWMIKKKEGMSLQFDTSWTHLEDRVFFLSIAEHGLYDYVEDVIYHIRRRPGSLMTNLSQLENAYARFLDHVNALGHIDPQIQIRERFSFHRMFFRTYLKHGRIISAIKHFFLMYSSR